MIVCLLDYPRCVVKSDGSKHEEARRMFGIIRQTSGYDV